MSASTHEFSATCYGWSSGAERWGGGCVESALSGRGENTFRRLRESAGARLRGRGEARRLGGCGELGGAETPRAWRAQ